MFQCQCVTELDEDKLFLLLTYDLASPGTQPCLALKYCFSVRGFLNISLKIFAYKECKGG